ncbi:SRPBCC family protein [Pedobacter sp. KACC 23697]|uniref:SRPBCC family protein n=1 Tax=Pedobacter sp. KACC 23697 TaxID=3149230 RepID=A0AAU7KB21_9SPHI
MKNSTTITVETTVNAPIEKVWEFWNNPDHMTKWSFASPDWHTPYAENDLKVGGTFKSTMAAKDGSMSFDFAGTYTIVDQHKKIEYTIEDGRKVSIIFEPLNEQTRVIETFDAESTHPIEMQRSGWQAILDNFKKYTEEL